MGDEGKGKKRSHDERASFLWLLVALLLMFLVSPLFSKLKFGEVAMSVGFTLILFTGVYAVSSDRRLLAVAVALAVPTLALEWVGALAGLPKLTAVAALLQVVFLALTTFVVLLYIARAQRISANLIYGSACVYLLLGILWGVIFALVTSFQPGAFTSAGGGPEEDLLYYSFATLTTVGYGDIVAKSPLARSLTCLEAVVGQFYMAVLVAKLVGIYIGQSLFRDGRARRTVEETDEHEG